MRTTAAGQASYTTGFEFMDQDADQMEQDLGRLFAAITTEAAEAD
jgi:hypothetical protein